ncbi:UDP-N-acetylglucosamine 1-carboxyvinyltransferase [Candidatus Kaiserbacteria bacterium CG10_big_fil_rev_8_21_14_0_10_45_20]|uniref:UDP-N-acetylglucosamine 1-carboxyvinyltransferase n=1 Tax=Candidatus Kaiserbacteria bacterium CG10_big_fil_rev_8_21_14_0_10_45_20 TaxID=1974607 RepID=A0A2H0UHX3_9BACT|nr:MAG: UDP-N-acetylglucosamine 1-carboxyvinyltransferase [Candidatus Kaiserbacteria bacterium CG10_big_fil_rev_8_21_14_0_10_45_20]
MDSFIVDGLAEKPTLEGEIAISGMKNAVLPIMAAAFVVEGETKLSNVPNIADVGSMSRLLEGLGAFVSHSGDELSIRTHDASGTVLEPQLAKSLRASVLLIGSVLARNGSVTFAHPGGCVLGSRPIDVFVDGLQKLGAELVEEDETYTLKAPNGLSGGEIFFRVMSVTGTEALMTAATRASGPVTLRNCAMEPEVVATADFLKSCGARIEGAGTSTIVIHPAHLTPNPEPVRIIPDRIEAASFLILGALVGKNIRITNAEPLHIEAVIETLRGMNVSISVTKEAISVSAPPHLKSTQIRTHEYPGFPTDAQAPMAVLLTQAEGESSILETVFDGRLNYTAELVRMGADIQIWNPHKATIKGKTDLKARDIDGPDIRAGLAFLLAASIAEGKSRIGNAHLIDRGYGSIEKKLSAVGLSISREQAS